MINCKACGKEIAKGVNFCIHCGNDQRNFFMKHKILTVIGVIVILGTLSSIGGNTTTTTNTTTTKQETKTEAKKEVKEEIKEEVMKVSVADLEKAYDENEIKADKTYKGKTIEVSGKISDINVMLGKTYVLLDPNKPTTLARVQCFFEEQNELDKVAELKKGGTVTIQGKVDGKSLFIDVNNCTIK